MRWRSTIVLAEIDRMVRELAADLKSGRGVAVVGAAQGRPRRRCAACAPRSTCRRNSPWGKQLAALRAEISKLLTAEIELMPGRVRRLMRPRPAKDIVPGSELDADEVAETEALIGFVATCRNYASELAVNEVTQRTFTELQQMLDTGTRTLLDALRSASDAERPFRQSQVDAAVRFCAKVFGQEYASLLDQGGRGRLARARSARRRPRPEIRARQASRRRFSHQDSQCDGLLRDSVSAPAVM